MLACPFLLQAAWMKDGWPNYNHCERNLGDTGPQGGDATLIEPTAPLGMQGEAAFAIRVLSLATAAAGTGRGTDSEALSQQFQPVRHHPND